MYIKIYRPSKKVELSLVMEKLIRGKTHIVDIDGVIRDKPDFPKALLRQSYTTQGSTGAEQVVDPVFTDEIVRNLYGRIMTLVEATTEASKLKAVKDVFSKELKQWSNDVFEEARELAYLAAASIDTDEDSK